MLYGWLKWSDQIWLNYEKPSYSVCVSSTPAPKRNQPYWLPTFPWPVWSNCSPNDRTAKCTPIEETFNECCCMLIRRKHDKCPERIWLHWRRFAWRLVVCRANCKVDWDSSIQGRNGVDQATLHPNTVNWVVMLTRTDAVENMIFVHTLCRLVNAKGDCAIRNHSHDHIAIVMPDFDDACRDWTQKRQTLLAPFSSTWYKFLASRRDDRVPCIKEPATIKLLPMNCAHSGSIDRRRNIFPACRTNLTNKAFWWF